MCILHNTHTYIVTIVLGALCDNIGLVGVSAKWSYVTASPSHHDQAIMTKPSLSCLLHFLCMLAIPYIPLFKIQRIFDLLVIQSTYHNYYTSVLRIDVRNGASLCFESNNVTKTSASSSWADGKIRVRGT